MSIDLWALDLINWQPIQYLIIVSCFALGIKIIDNTLKGR